MFISLVMFQLGLAQILQLRLSFYRLGLAKIKAQAILMGLGQLRLSFGISHGFAYNLQELNKFYLT